MSEPEAFTGFGYWFLKANPKRIKKKCPVCGCEVVDKIVHKGLVYYKCCNSACRYTWVEK